MQRSLVGSEMCIRDSTKAAVLPVPVCAEAIRSAPDSTTGIARCCISVGLVKPAFSIDCCILESSLSSLNRKIDPHGIFAAMSRKTVTRFRSPAKPGLTSSLRINRQGPRRGMGSNTSDGGQAHDQRRAFPSPGRRDYTGLTWKIPAIEWPWL